MPNKNSIESEIDKVVSQTIQVSRIGRATDPKPKDQVWFTTQMQDLFVLDTTILKQQIDKLIQREVKKGRVEELENVWYDEKEKLLFCTTNGSQHTLQDRLTHLKKEDEK